MIKVGCAGFPIAQDRYWRSLSFLEAKTGEVMPRPDTLASWKSGAPAQAEFAVQAYRLITHRRDDRGFPPAGRKLTPARQGECGAFRDSLEVHEAWLATKAAAETLGARIVVFETPASLEAGPDRLRDLYRFFKKIGRGKLSLVWQPRGFGDARLVEKVCAELGLIRAVDPLKERVPERGAFAYLRPQGPRVATFGVDDLATIRRAAAEAPSYVVLSHRAAFLDAEKLTAPARISYTR